MGKNYKIKEDKDGNIVPWRCPRCKEMCDRFPALSRRDNETNICPDCGTAEAMEDWAGNFK